MAEAAWEVVALRVPVAQLHETLPSLEREGLILNDLTLYPAGAPGL